MVDDLARKVDGNVVGGCLIMSKLNTSHIKQNSQKVPQLMVLAVYQSPNHFMTLCSSTNTFFSCSCSGLAHIQLCPFFVFCKIKFCFDFWHLAQWMTIFKETTVANEFQL